MTLMLESLKMHKEKIRYVETTLLKQNANTPEFSNGVTKWSSNLLDHDIWKYVDVW